MLLPTFLSASALALTANAFLLPLEVTNDQTSPFDPTSFAQQSQTINLDCSTCPFALGKNQDGTVWKQGIQNDLVMEFTAEDNSLKLNGVPFYPVEMPPLPPAISAKQVRKDGEEDPSFPTNVEPVRLSYSLEFEKEKATKGPQDPVLVEALMTVMGLEGQMVRVDNIEIKAFKSPNGEVSIPVLPQSVHHRANRHSSNSFPSPPKTPLPTRLTRNAQTSCVASSPKSQPNSTKPARR